MSQIIGLVGFIGSGKNAAADILVEKQGFVVESFAKSVKDSVAVVFGWDRQMLEGATPQSRIWRETKDEFWSQKLGKDISPRYALQLMGTEAGRNVFGTDLWVWSLLNRLESNKNYVITDTRFPNELKMIAESGGKIIRIKRGPEPEWYDEAKDINSIQGGQTMPLYPDIHFSEWAWIDSPHITHTITNDGTIKDLEDKLWMVCHLLS